MRTLEHWLRREPFSIALSSGFFGFFSHLGFVKALYEASLKPISISGSSAGALLGAMVASGVELEHIESQLLEIRKEDFWDPGFGLGLLKGRLFKELLANLLPVSNFEACGTPLSVSVFCPLLWKTRIINSGQLVTAVYASCAVPGLFQPQWFGGVPHWDGGIGDREAVKSFQRQQRILHHHIPSRDSNRKLDPVIKYYSNLMSITLSDIPRCGPDQLDMGKQIIEKSYQQTCQRLSMSIK